MVNKRFTKSGLSFGSALILTVVLTSMLAIVGVLFMLVARLDKMATSSISQNRELNLAVETAIAEISQELVLDAPGEANQEYYDYPDSNNIWLACLEPYQFAASDYRWRQISDIYKRFSIPSSGLEAGIVPDYQVPSQIGDSNNTVIYHADADGDGVADSAWVLLPDMTSSKGKPIYAAVRIIDNGGMLNVNTAYEFDPCSTDIKLIDGSSQTQIDLLSLAKRGSTSNPSGKLEDVRYGSEPHILDNYINDVVWRYDIPDGHYTPFDIGDELELRNRFLINLPDTETRIENVWTNAFKNLNLRTPVTSDLIDWFYRAQHDVIGPNDIYSYRHIATTYNMDRIINPDGEKMVNVNSIFDPNYLIDLHQAIVDSGIDGSTAAQIAVNIKDYIDSDSDVVTVYDGHYGFECPCIYISELDYNAVTIVTVDPPTSQTFKSYAVELYKPYSGDNDPVGWQLVVGGSIIPIDNWINSKQYYVIHNVDPAAKLTWDSSNAGDQGAAELEFYDNPLIELQRYVAEVDNYITVDSIEVPIWLVTGDGIRSFQRDINEHKCIRRLWDTETDIPTLGQFNTFEHSDANQIQAHPENMPFTNIGEIGRIFHLPIPFDKEVNEAEVCFDLQNQVFQQIFNYLTVFDPSSDAINNDGDYDPNLMPMVDEDDGSEWKVPGRININTAPWFVLAQLPWVSQREEGYDSYALAKAIVAYRDKLAIQPVGPDYSDRAGKPGFRSIGELNNIVESYAYFRIDYYALDEEYFPPGPPVPYPPPGVEDDIENGFEQRDYIFSRISNLVTVRSDVFTAYILVRIGKDGPQKRVMAILDRSDVNSSGGKVRIIALHPVPDPR